MYSIWLRKSMSVSRVAVTQSKPVETHSFDTYEIDKLVQDGEHMVQIEEDIIIKDFFDPKDGTRYLSKKCMIPSLPSIISYWRSSDSIGHKDVIDAYDTGMTEIEDIEIVSGPFYSHIHPFILVRYENRHTILAFCPDYVGDCSDSHYKCSMNDIAVVNKNCISPHILTQEWSDNTGYMIFPSSITLIEVEHTKIGKTLKRLSVKDEEWIEYNGRKIEMEYSYEIDSIPKYTKEVSYKDNILSLTRKSKVSAYIIEIKNRPISLYEGRIQHLSDLHIIYG